MDSPLLSHLSKVLSLSPPQSSYSASTLTGPLTSHTGTAYLFLSISSAFPRLQVHSYPAIHWARAYISNIPAPDGPISSLEECLGLSSDVLSGTAVRACITQDLSHVRTFLNLLTPILASINSRDTAPLPSCLVHGLAGTLYLLRLIRHWVASSAPLVSRAIVHISEYLLSVPWSCPRSSSHGAADGELGTLTQLVLTSPPLAPRLAEKLTELLELQGPDGDWPSPAAPAQPGSRSECLTFATGATGLVVSLASLRPFFPSLQDRLDAVVADARDFIARHQRELLGETSLWYGTLGTSLAFPKGLQRTNSMNLPSPSPTSESTSTGESSTESSSPGAVAKAHDPGAAWVLAVCEREMPRMLFYNDV
ncbi:abscisic acid ABA receptor [Colletotrichum karsti]|uniref:Abscisic acid ABA receptor n=1 Tax=Colletotrichum karsti TaxID=1095194 RepID=A0A9P6HXG0_9PEZI|nr:abscisic acid ABA receptor [Colletotrichum karsti]KAF9871910.1 abscisic acid ABA receptor [Colletotrichum karsti]